MKRRKMTLNTQTPIPEEQACGTARRGRAVAGVLLLESPHRARQGMGHKCLFVQAGAGGINPAQSAE